MLPELIIVISFYNFTVATKLYFTYYSFVVIIFSIRVYLSLRFHPIISETSFCPFVFNLFSVFAFWIRHNYNISIIIISISIISPSLILFSLYKNYFIFLKIRLWHILVKTCFQRDFELIKSTFRACLHETRSELKPVWDFTSG